MTRPLRILITGHRGQLGQALHRLRPEAQGVSRLELDITDAQAVETAVRSLQPELIVHCAAFTSVDEAVRQPDQAYRVNALGTRYLAEAAARQQASFAYLSTNEVFDGGTTSPYMEDDRANPINPYGLSKWAGETILQQTLERFFIIRTSWLSCTGGRNFAQRIQQLADEGKSLKIVTDEIACPTFVHDLAPAIWKLLDTRHCGIYHLVNQGFCSRFELARRILDITGRQHLALEPITLAQFQRASRPPPFSALANRAAANLGIALPAWEESLQVFLRTA